VTAYLAAAFEQLTEASYNGPSLVEWYEETISRVPALFSFGPWMPTHVPTSKGSISENPTVWKTLRSDPLRGQSMQSVWDAHFGPNGSPKRSEMPSTTNKRAGGPVHAAQEDWRAHMSTAAISASLTASLTLCSTPYPPDRCLLACLHLVS
jgi:hypothetical protein